MRLDNPVYRTYLKKTKTGRLCNMGCKHSKLIKWRKVLFVSILGSLSLSGVLWLSGVMGIVSLNPCNMGPCIIMLQHEVMFVDEWHNNGPQDLITVSLCIQNDINKMHLCSLSITYACPYHNLTVTMGHSIHNLDISKPLTHTTPYTLSAICPVQ